ncbi:4-hydroxythreonine-4-phosphate dehydrogenase PdxA [Proteiniclasticum sp. SCR006]|uniref:Putative D-threonate 4-phosphate dehydrogenase n=1 Tax=Proteiniclasticum aestuarii TaxID=2817862 RepID=A0A939KJW0_9CLOT|nr:4-hydroxythreonine-4-phosphate dehydrogenase PdxA [Proteiniclasticum aestuarii]MBO1265456.1 4-hydroxythreonine-4-phosphate dehydrogenase PdxA [Proteiniclasticum aestuarii]
MNQLPILGITMGDVSGIGPEIAVKALNHKEVYETCRPLVVGNSDIVKRAVELIGNDLKVHVIEHVVDAEFRYGTIDVYHRTDFNIEDVPYGQVSTLGGKAAFEAIEKVIELAMEDKIDATITGPLNKEALNKAGYHYNGHTEIYAELTDTKRYSMMLAHENFRVVHVSTHVSLRKACDLVKKERVREVIEIAQNACLSLGINNPKIAVAGLNPHSGEGGLFGDEEINEIIPAIEDARSRGINVEGPVPPDTVFSKAIGGQYDIVVAMYHDQGHIPMKVVGFQMDQSTGSWKAVNGVNITLGLPIIRSSVDHGTAFDQAGKGTASEESLLNAISYGIDLAKARLNKKKS